MTVLDDLSAWSDEWDMILNISKTKVMLFGSNSATVNLTLHGAAVEPVSYTHLTLPTNREV